MALSDEDRRRIDEEEYRKLSRERLERTERIRADTPMPIVQPIEAPIQPSPATTGTTVPLSPFAVNCATGFIGGSVVVSAVATGGLSLIPIACIAGLYGVYKLGSRSR